MGRSDLPVREHSRLNRWAENIRLRRCRVDRWEPRKRTLLGPPKTNGWACKRYSEERALGRPAGRRANGPDLLKPRRARPRRKPILQGSANDNPRHLGRNGKWKRLETVALIRGGHTFGKAAIGAVGARMPGPRSRSVATGKSSRALAGPHSTRPPRAIHALTQRA